MENGLNHVRQLTPVHLVADSRGRGGAASETGFSQHLLLFAGRRISQFPGHDSPIFQSDGSPITM